MGRPPTKSRPVSRKRPLPCIYCGGRGPRTEEHVLQEGFGGPRVVLKDDVCGRCNNEFSGIDADFIAFVRTFSLAATHPDQRFPRTKVDGVICFWFNPVEGVQEAVRTVGRGPIETRTARVFPQLTFVEGEGPVFRTDGLDGDAPAMLRLMISELRAPGVRVSTHNAVPDMAPLPAPPPMIVRSARGKYMIIAEPDDEQRIRRIIASPTFDVLPASQPESSKHPQPLVHGRKVINTGAILRAVAKVAVNFVCKVLGRTVALTDTLASLRRAARAKSRAGDTVTMSVASTEPLLVGNGQSLAPPDVGLLEDLAAAHCDPGHHALVLLPQPAGMQLFLLALYGKPVATLIVHLPSGERAALLIDYCNHTSKCVHDPKGASWFKERMGRFGALRLRRAQVAAGIAVAPLGS